MYPPTTDMAVIRACAAYLRGRDLLVARDDRGLYGATIVSGRYWSRVRFTVRRASRRGAYTVQVGKHPYRIEEARVRADGTATKAQGLGRAPLAFTAAGYRWRLRHGGGRLPPWGGVLHLDAMLAPGDVLTTT